MKYSLSLLMGLVAAVSTATASPVLYALTFTGGTPNATGSLEYDASAATNPFSLFDVDWDGIVFDLTTAANDASYASGQPCTVATGAGELFEALTVPACGGAAWEAVSQVESELLIYGNGTDINAYGPGELPQYSAHGTVSATATPEPSSLGLVIAGGVGLAWRRRRKQTKVNQTIPN